MGEGGRNIGRRNGRGVDRRTRKETAMKKEEAMRGSLLGKTVRRWEAK